MNIIRMCRKRIRRIAQDMGGKSHIAYLAAATIVDSNLILRVCCGSCLVFCLIVTLVRDKEEKI